VNGKLKFELKLHYRKISEEEFVADLKRVAAVIGKNSVTSKEYDRYGKFSSGACARRFGSWFVALEKAGLEKTRNFGVTKKELFANMKEVWIKLGRQPRSDEMRRPLSMHGAGIYAARFGSWTKALERFVEYVNSGEPEIVEVVVKRAAKVRKNSRRGIASGVRLKVMARDGFRCRLCGRSPAMHPGISLHIDHIKALSRGGGNEPGNLQTLCSECNISKGAGEAVSGNTGVEISAEQREG
jgi:hypothetical protein